MGNVDLRTTPDSHTHSHQEEDKEEEGGYLKTSLLGSPFFQHANKGTSQGTGKVLGQEGRDGGGLA